MVKFKKNIGSDVMLSGNFYELLVAFSLVKKDLQVIRADSVAFDLLVVDEKNKVFKHNNIGISVKGRESKDNFSMPFKELKIPALNKQCKIWNFEPYYAFVSLSNICFIPLVEVIKLKKKSKIKSLSLKGACKNKSAIVFKWETPK